MFGKKYGSRMDEENAKKGPFAVGNYDISNSENTVIKTYKFVHYACGEVTGVSLKLNNGTFIFKTDRIEIFKPSTGGMLIGGLLGGAVGGSIVGAIEASRVVSGGGSKPTIIIPYVNIVRYVPSNVVRNKSIIFYLNDGNVYTLCFGVESTQKEALSILKQYYR